MKKNEKKCKKLLTFQKLCVYNITRKAKAELNLKKLIKNYMTKSEKITRLLNISDELNKNRVSSLVEKAEIETAELLSGFDIYLNLEDEVYTYAQDEARPTNHASKRYIKHGKTYYDIWSVGISKVYGQQYGRFQKI
jgi:ubiquinone biosynthesis protein COQ9